MYRLGTAMPRVTYTDMVDRLQKSVKIDSNGCWIWQWKLSSGGYGRMSVTSAPNKFRTLAAHRVSYETFIGPIGKDLEIDHLCRVRNCINPKHLEPVTRKENVKRGISFAAINMKKTHCVNGHEYTPENTFIRKNGRTCRECHHKWTKNYYERTKNHA